MIGGKIIASGGFGCIFDPPLLCDTNQTNKNQISKLMTDKKAKDEYNEIQNIRQIVKTIPNYSDYFLLDNFEICRPIKLTNQDLKHFDKKCKPLRKQGINKQNINSSLDKLLTLNMPNGGIDISVFIDNYFNHKTNIRILNNSLIRLLVKGIIPMNELGVYHCDIKDSNILADVLETDIITRLIDWGLSIHKTDKNRGIPRKLYRRPFQYNVPFSSILFTAFYISNADFQQAT